MLRKKRNELIPHPKWQNNIHYEKPEAPENLYKNHIVAIMNAYDADAFLDEEGKLWISAKRLHTILRTQKNAKEFIIDRINIRDKKNINGEIFIKGGEINKQITNEIENSGQKKRGEYLRFSEKCLNAIRDSYTAKAKRGEYEAYFEEEKKKLKRKRIKKYRITHDELTGKVLDQRTAEFSHIRSVKNFKELALYIENGLIVNKEIHDRITSYGINDEEQLLHFCNDNNFDKSWYENYINFIERFKEGEI